MAKLRINVRRNWITVLLFQLCVIANNVFGMDEKLFMVSKVVMLLFFGVMLFRILYKGKVRYNHILLLPILFTIYCVATALWAYYPSEVMSQMVTQIQLFLLLLFTFWGMSDGITTTDYLNAVNASGFGMMVYMLVNAGGPVQYFNAMLSGERMGGGYANPYGMVFGNAALSAAYYMILKGKKKHVFSIILFTFFALSSASRKAMLMVVVGIIAMVVMHYGWRRIYWTVLVAAALMLLLPYVLQLPYFGEIGERFANLLSGKQDGSDVERVRMMEYGWELFKEKPIQGYGLANFKRLYYYITYSHNNYIELLVSGGVVALVLYYLMHLVPIAGMLMGRRKGEKLPEMHLMLLVWLGVEWMFGIAMVQMYNKNSWLLIGVLMAESVQAVHSRNRALQENGNENRG